MPYKLFFLTTEITPFAKTSPLADFSAKVPLILQGKEHDIRTMLPKYGFVSERKYILREVIRLREIPFEFAGVEQMSSAKSAFIPKTRVQVYFLEHLEWFKPLTNLLYKSKNGRILSDNDMRYAFYASAALATLPHLFWSPDMVICNGWQSSFIPIIYNQLYKNKEFYHGIKTVQIVHSVDDFSLFKLEAYDAAGVVLPEFLKADVVNCQEVAACFADLVIVFNTPGNNLADELLKMEGVKANEGKIVVIDWDDAESPDYTAIADSIDEALQKLSA